MGSVACARCGHVRFTDASTCPECGATEALPTEPTYLAVGPPPAMRPTIPGSYTVLPDPVRRRRRISAGRLVRELAPFAVLGLVLVLGAIPSEPFR